MWLEDAEAAGMDQARLARAFALVGDWVDADRLGGAAALVCRGGVVAGEAYVGHADPERGRPVDAETVWHLASITKAMTAAAVMVLVERGELSLAQPVHLLVPEFLEGAEDPRRRSVRLVDLLTHTSGLPEFSDDDRQLRLGLQPLEAFVASHLRQPLRFDPGSAIGYSNVAVAIAGEVVGRAVTGTLGRPLVTPAIDAYRRFVADEVLAPLGMVDSTLQPPPAWDERVAWLDDEHDRGEPWQVANSAWFRALGMPWGGAFSTARDLARFADTFLPAAEGRPRLPAGRAAGTSSRILGTTSIRAMTSTQVELPDVDVPTATASWGLGWFAGRRPNGVHDDLGCPLPPSAVFGHTGSSGAMVWGLPEEDLLCVLLTNRPDGGELLHGAGLRVRFSSAVQAALGPRPAQPGARSREL